MRACPLAEMEGAVGSQEPDAVADPDRLVPAHFGNPLREQSLLAEGRAVVALARDVMTVTGPDRLSWLTTLSSQVLTGLTPGDGGVETLLLDAQGHVTHAMAAVDDGEVLYLVTDAGDGPALAGFLDSMRFMLRVEVRQREDLVVLGSHGGGVAVLEEAARRAGMAAVAWRDPWPGVVPGGTSYDVGLGSPDRPYRHPGAGYEAGYVLVAAEQARQVVADLLAQGLRPAGALAWEALRVEAGRPRWAREVDERVIPPELDWLRTAVHLTKGCFPGQETIARTLNLGRPPRRLTILQLDGLSGDRPSPGDRVLLGERAVGVVTSVVLHHEYGPMALALLRRAVPADARLTVEVTQPEACEGGLPGSPVEDGPSGRPGPRPAESVGGMPVSPEGAGLPGDPEVARQPGDPEVSADGLAVGPGQGVGEGTGESRRVVVGRVDAVQELLVSPEGKAQASPAQRPGAELRTSLLRRPGSDR